MNTVDRLMLTAIARQVDNLETLVDGGCLAEANPQALSNLLARLQRVQQTIEIAARK